MTEQQAKAAAADMARKGSSKKDKFSQLNTALIQRRDEYDKVLQGSGLHADLFIESFKQYVLANPEILTWEPQSVIRSVGACVSVGLLPHGAVAGAYFVGFRNKRTNQTICQIIVDYRALIDLAVRGGGCTNVEAEAVYEDDSFALEGGLYPSLRHTYDIDKSRDERGAFRGVYAVATLPSGEKKLKWMNAAEITEARTRSRAGNSGPWVTDFEAMAKKCVVRSLLNFIPKSATRLSALARALDMDSRTDRGIVDTSAYVPTKEWTSDELEEIDGQPPEIRDAEVEPTTTPVEEEPEEGSPMTEQEKEDLCRQQGSDAALEGASHKTCPYKKGTDAYGWWQDAYNTTLDGIDDDGSGEG